MHGSASTVLHVGPSEVHEMLACLLLSSLDDRYLDSDWSAPSATTPSVSSVRTLDGARPDQCRVISRETKQPLAVACLFAKPRKELRPDIQCRANADWNLAPIRAYWSC